jgi:hypothetical protein
VRFSESKQDGFEEDLDLVMQAKLNEVWGQGCYLMQGRYRDPRYNKFEEVLQMNKMNDYEFLFHYCDKDFHFDNFGIHIIMSSYVI